MKKSTYVSVIAYTYNDENCVEDFVLKLDDFLYKNFEYYEIILIDDSSTDNTVKRAFKLKDIVMGNVTIIELKGSHGIDRGFYSGTDISIGDYIYEIESIAKDYPFEILLDMYNKSQNEGYDIVFNSSKDGRGIISRCYSKFIKHLSKGKIDNNMSKLRLVTRRALYSIGNDNQIISNRNFSYSNCGFNYIHIESESTTDYNGPLNVRVSRDLKILVLYTDIFNRLPLYFSIGFFIMGLFFIMVGFLNLDFIDPIIKLWPIMALTSIGFSFIFLLFGVIYRLLTIVLNRKLDSKLYKIKDITRINRY